MAIVLVVCGHLIEDQRDHPMAGPGPAAAALVHDPARRGRRHPVRKLFRWAVEPRISWAFTPLRRP
ncbi:hypothetical protein [Nonomuraea sp. JJY05]|uniref:hypothetical protein n=1 Tax=Nonomuraea sp. JJY05 TaxID=3350255 RepID=UPI00373F1308